MAERVDCIVIGAGVVGLAVASAMARTGREVWVLEAEAAIGTGTSSRNSEVIHAGIYYPANSLKARLCREGRDLLYAYCATRGVAHRRCGKLIVARHGETDQLHVIAGRALANGVADVRHLDAREIAVLEPNVSAEAGLMSPSTGIVDSHAFMLALQGDLEDASGLVVCRAPVVGGQARDDGVLVHIGGAGACEMHARVVVNSAGLDAPRIAASIGGLPAQTVPTQHLAIGHYYAFSGPSPFRHLVYPTPEAGGLGIHATLDLANQTRFGPDVRWIDHVDYSFDDSRFDEFVAAIRSYYPGLDPSRLSEGYTGIRPKLTGPGDPASDFRIDGPETHGINGLINLFGIESPGLTAALAIAELVVERLGKAD